MFRRIDFLPKAWWEKVLLYLSLKLKKNQEAKPNILNALGATLDSLTGYQRSLIVLDLFSFGNFFFGDFFHYNFIRGAMKRLFVVEAADGDASFRITK